MPDYDLITILGPTASGKTPFAAALAHELNTELSVPTLVRSIGEWTSVRARTWQIIQSTDIQFLIT